MSARGSETKTLSIDVDLKSFDFRDVSIGRLTRLKSGTDVDVKENDFDTPSVLGESHHDGLDTLLHR